MKKLRRLFVFLMVLVLALSSTALALEPGEIPLSDETITFTVGVQESAVIEDWDTNKQTLKLENELNLDLQFVEFPSDGSEFTQKVELMMMAGGDDLPDMFMQGLTNLSTLQNYGAMGMIVPVTEYYHTIAYYTEQTLADAGYTLDERLAYVTSPDGEVYGVFKRCLRDEYDGSFDRLLADLSQFAHRFLDDQEFREEAVALSQRWIADMPEESISELKLFGD